MKEWRVKKIFAELHKEHHAGISDTKAARKAMEKVVTRIVRLGRFFDPHTPARLLSIYGEDALHACTNAVKWFLAVGLKYSIHVTLRKVRRLRSSVCAFQSLWRRYSVKKRTEQAAVLERWGLFEAGMRLSVHASNPFKDTFQLPLEMKQRVVESLPLTSPGGGGGGGAAAASYSQPPAWCRGSVGEGQGRPGEELAGQMHADACSAVSDGIDTASQTGRGGGGARRCPPPPSPGGVVAVTYRTKSRFLQASNYAPKGKAKGKGKSHQRQASYQRTSQQLQGAVSGDMQPAGHEGECGAAPGYTPYGTAYRYYDDEDWKCYESGRFSPPRRALQERRALQKNYWMKRSQANKKARARGGKGGGGGGGSAKVPAGAYPNYLRGEGSQQNSPTRVSSRVSSPSFQRCNSVLAEQYAASVRPLYKGPSCYEESVTCRLRKRFFGTMSHIKQGSALPSC